MPECAICSHLSLPPRNAAGTVGLLTDFASIQAAALDRFEAEGETQHIVVNACAEHVVDVYRGRIDGVQMAWKLSNGPTAPDFQNLATASASPA
jgi:hypothetical protein